MSAETSAGATAPLIVTATLPPSEFAWADALRRAHFPPERNYLQAHVTLFHALPPFVEDEARGLRDYDPAKLKSFAAVQDIGRKLLSEDAGAAARWQASVDQGKGADLETALSAALTAAGKGPSAASAKPTATKEREQV